MYIIDEERERQLESQLAGLQEEKHLLYAQVDRLTDRLREAEDRAVSLSHSNYKNKLICFFVFDKLKIFAIKIRTHMHQYTQSVEPAFIKVPVPIERMPPSPGKLYNQPKIE